MKYFFKAKVFIDYKEISLTSTKCKNTNLNEYPMMYYILWLLIAENYFVPYDCHTLNADFQTKH